MRRVFRNLLLVLGGALLLLLATIGVATLLRDARTSVVRAHGDPDGVPDAAEAAFAHTAALLTGTPLLPGNRVDILRDGAGTFPLLFRDLLAAQRSLTVQLYYVTPGTLLDSLAAVLAARARAGVRTHFLYDAVGAEIPDSVLRTLRAAGVRSAEFRPVRWYTLRKAQHRSHARIAVIDGRTGYTGGFGIDDRWLGAASSPGEWRETNVRVRGPAVAQLQAAFVSAWAEATGELLTGDLYFPPSSTQAGGTPAADSASTAALAGVLHAQPTPGNTDAERLLALSIAGARERLYITSAYFVPGAELIRQLRAAAHRGVDVRVLVPGTHTDVPLTRWAARGAYERLLRAGVRIFEYQPTMVHAKTMVVDGAWSVIGTMNLDTRSLVHNEEILLLAWDRGTGAELDALFHADLEHAQEIDRDRFARRPWREKVRERLARQLTRIL